MLDASNCRAQGLKLVAVNCTVGLVKRPGVRAKAAQWPALNNRTSRKCQGMKNLAHVERRQEKAASETLRASVQWSWGQIRPTKQHGCQRQTPFLTLIVLTAVIFLTLGMVQ